MRLRYFSGRALQCKRLSTSHIKVGSRFESCLLCFQSSFLLIHLKRNRWWQGGPGLLPPCVRHGWSSWLQALAWPRPSCREHLGSETENSRSLWLWYLRFCIFPVLLAEICPLLKGNPLRAFAVSFIHLSITPQATYCEDTCLLYQLTTWG